MCHDTCKDAAIPRKGRGGLLRPSLWVRPGAGHHGSAGPEGRAKQEARPRRRYTADILRQIYHGRYITADILRQINSDRYIEADIFRQLYYGRCTLSSSSGFVLTCWSRTRLLTDITAQYTHLSLHSRKILPLQHSYIHANSYPQAHRKLKDPIATPTARQRRQTLVGQDAVLPYIEVLVCYQDGRLLWPCLQQPAHPLAWRRRQKDGSMTMHYHYCNNEGSGPKC